MNIGDLVYLKKSTSNIKFIINKITNDMAVISAVNYRLILDAPLKDLEYISSKEVNKISNYDNCYSLNPRIIQNSSDFSRILHIDSEKCI